MDRHHGDPAPLWVHIGYAVSLLAFILVGAGFKAAELVNSADYSAICIPIMSILGFSFIFFLLPLGWGWPALSYFHKNFANPPPAAASQPDQPDQNPLNN